MHKMQSEIEKIVMTYFHDAVAQITPIGHHDLNRHLVYKVDLTQSQCVLKFYYKWNRRNREIAAHKVLETSTNVKIPQMIGYGTLEDGQEWMAYEFVEGSELDEIKPKLSAYDQDCLFEEMGEQLGKIHGARQFKYFGDWNEDGKSLQNITQFKPCFIMRQESHVRTLRKFNLPEERMLESAIQLMRSQYDRLDDVEESRMCHRDYDGRNILVKCGHVKWEIAAILDFEQSSPYYTGVDMVNLYRKYFLDEPNLEKAFFTGYSRFHTIDEHFKSLKDYLLLCLGVAICSWSYNDARPHYYEGIRILEYLRLHSNFKF